MIQEAYIEFLGFGLPTTTARPRLKGAAAPQMVSSSIHLTRVTR